MLGRSKLAGFVHGKVRGGSPCDLTWLFKAFDLITTRERDRRHVDSRVDIVERRIHSVARLKCPLSCVTRRGNAVGLSSLPLSIVGCTGQHIHPAQRKSLAPPSDAIFRTSRCTVAFSSGFAKVWARAIFFVTLGESLRIEPARLQALPLRCPGAPSPREH